jgi:thioredoxin reductase
LAILGGGPIGLECALYASCLGFRVTVFERDRIGSNVARWGHVRMFSPWEMNVSPLARRRLAERGLEPSSSPQDCPTGEELIRDYLEPLSMLPELAGRIRTGVQVLACGRRGIRKNMLSPESGRAAFPFRILTCDREGAEAEHEADIVIDATGVYGNARELGDGGLPALGERDIQGQIDREPIDVLGKNRTSFAGKRVMLIGSGFSAATTLQALLQLERESPGTEIFWVSRTDGPRPIPEIENDSLPERARLSRVANEAARQLPPGLHYFGGYLVKAVRQSGGAIEATVAGPSGDSKTIVCDRIVSNVGYRPDASIYRELQVHECYATLGPMKLAASLMSQEGEDCLLIESGDAELLKNPEPNFYILGSKSFGTNSAFLLKLGHEQIAQVFTLITGDTNLNLYTS